MAELGWIASKVTQEHLQNLMSQGYMMAVELVTCRMPKDPTSLVLAWGIHCGMCGILQAGIWCYNTLISSLFATVLWLGTI
jgi:hypothetical protein